MKKKLNRFLLSSSLMIFSSVLLSGCWDYLDVEDRSLVLSIGVDLPEHDKIRFDDEIAEFIYSTSNKTDYTLAHYWGEGTNFERARIDLEMKLRGQITNGATGALIISERFAREKGLAEYLNRVNKLYDIRKTTSLVISRKPPQDLFKSSLREKRSIGIFVEDNIKQLFDDAHINTTIGRAVSDSRMEDMGYLVPCMDMREGKLQYTGLAIIKHGKLIDIADVWDTTGILFINARKTPLYLSIADPNNKENILACKTKVKSNRIKTTYVNGNPVINIVLNINTSIQYQYRISPLTDGDMYVLKDTISREIKRQVMDAIKKSQDTYQCDIFYFAKYFKAQNPLVYRNIDWEEAYPKSEVNVNINVNITDKNAMDYDNKEKLDKR